MAGYYMDEQDTSGWYTSDTPSGYDVPSTGGYDGYGGQPPSSWGHNTYEKPMDPFGAAPNYYGGNINTFMPNEQLTAAATANVSFEDEPPLLEELGINFEHIRDKTLAVLNPMKETSAEAIQDQDLAGPLLFCLLFGGALLFHGKVHFGYIYGIGVVGCVGMYALLNLMSLQGVSFTCTVSVLGYCLLPMALLSLLGVVLSFKGVIGLCTACLAVLWCSITSSKLFVTALSMDHQRFLVAYPCILLYGMFALLAVF